jgi:CBS domain-containing protein
MKDERKDIITAADLMKSPVCTVRANQTLADVASLFTKEMISAAAVVSVDGRPIGVITKTDLVRYGTTSWTRQRGLPILVEEALVEGWMTPVVLSVPADSTACSMARRMSRYHIHHMFVRGKRPDEIIGIVSSLDLLRAYFTLCDRMGIEKAAVL